VRKQFDARGARLHVVCASGGNAGLAAAAAAQSFGVRCTIYLPEGVDARTWRFLTQLGAEICAAGNEYSKALDAAESAVAQDENAVLIPAYDHHDIWEGHSTMVDEIKRQLPEGVTPDAIFCSVGGGGLLGGIILGCKQQGWDDVPIVALETHGSNCFFEAMVANKRPDAAVPDNIMRRTDEKHNVKIARLHKLTSKATSLGASEASAAVVRMALDRSGGVQSATVPDEMSMQVVKSFADEHKILAELACATALSPAYAANLIAKFVPPVPGEKKHVVFIACGGFKVSVEDLIVYEATVKARASEEWVVKLDDGSSVVVPKFS